MSSNAFNLIVRPEYYATLTLESLIAALVNPANNDGTLLRPPLQQPVLDLGQSQIPITTVKQLVDGTSQSRAAKPWLRWFQDVYQWITQAAPAAGSQFIEVLAPSVDETDTAWYGTSMLNSMDDAPSITITLVGLSRFGIQFTLTAGGTGYSSPPDISVASSNGNGQPALGTGVLDGTTLVGWNQTTQGYDLQPPLVVTISGGGGSGGTAEALLGRQFAAGDFIVWNDPSIVNSAYSYEIDQITAITPTNDTSFVAKLQRKASGGAAGTAQYGSLQNIHGPDTQIFRLINRSWVFPVDVAAGPQVVPLIWPNMTVAAVNVGQQGQSSLTANLAPIAMLPTSGDAPPRLLPPMPGLRTMNGAAYTGLGFPASLSMGTVAFARVSAQAWESIRTVYAKVQMAPAGPTAFMGNTNACIVVYVCYISADGMTVGLIDTVVINNGDFASYQVANAPDGRQMPYHVYYPYVTPYKDWPPNQLPVLTGALSGSGALQLGWTVSTTQTVTFAPDGQIDFIIGQVGTASPGGNIIVTVQT